MFSPSAAEHIDGKRQEPKQEDKTMFKAINAAHTESRTFDSYAEAYRFVMREGDRSKLWGIYASSAAKLADCAAEKASFFGRAA
jgi:hypothetical protein